MIRNHNLRPRKTLTRFTNPIDLVGICLNIHRKYWRVMAYSLAIEFNIFRHILECFTQHWVERFARAAVDLREAGDDAGCNVDHS